MSKPRSSRAGWSISRGDGAWKKPRALIAVVILGVAMNGVFTVGSAALRGEASPAFADGDSDGDGWTDSAETTIGTDPLWQVWRSLSVSQRHSAVHR